MAFGGLIGNNVKIFASKVILLAITLLCEVGYGHHATVNGLSELQLSSTTMKLLQYTVSSYLY